MQDAPPPLGCSRSDGTRSGGSCTFTSAAGKFRRGRAMRFLPPLFKINLGGLASNRWHFCVRAPHLQPQRYLIPVNHVGKNRTGENSGLLLALCLQPVPSVSPACIPKLQAEAPRLDPSCVFQNRIVSGGILESALRERKQHQSQLHFFKLF